VAQSPERKAAPGRSNRGELATAHEVSKETCLKCRGSRATSRTSLCRCSPAPARCSSSPGALPHDLLHSLRSADQGIQYPVDQTEDCHFGPPRAEYLCDTAASRWSAIAGAGNDLPHAPDTMQKPCAEADEARRPERPTWRLTWTNRVPVLRVFRRHYATVLPQPQGTRPHYAPPARPRPHSPPVPSRPALARTPRRASRSRFSPNLGRLPGLRAASCRALSPPAAISPLQRPLALSSWCFALVLLRSLSLSLPLDSCFASRQLLFVRPRTPLFAPLRSVLVPSRTTRHCFHPRSAPP